MNNLHVFILLTILLVVHGDEGTCQCVNLKSEQDCSKFPLQYCEWKNNTCVISTQTTQNPVIEGKPFCSQYASIQDCQKAFICTNCQNKQQMCDGCLKQYPCVWEGSQCQFFTGCSAYVSKSHAECNAISSMCTSDLTQCIQIGECTEYNTVDACKQKNIRAQQCTWDPQLGCKELASCSEISKLQSTSHDACNSQLAKCTVNNNSQCVDLSAECGDYTFEDQCKLTSSQVKCAWSNNICREVSCEDAPLSYDYNGCRQFMQSCTAKSGGGCQKIIYCTDLKNQSDCQNKEDTNGKSCFWVSTFSQCVIHECSQAPLDYQTDKQCQSFKSECVTNEGIGCKLNTGCSAIATQQECNTTKSAEGKDCMWEDSCVEKVCENASTKLTTHEQCEKFLFQCTTDYGYGCQTKTCKNAPDTLKTNEDCERYLPDNHCITRSGGGCIQNDSCSKVSIAIACVKDINGSDCQWYEQTDKCITKQCNKAPTTINTQELCQSFWSKCKVNQSGTGCEDRICENFYQQDTCKGQLDFYGRTCSWRNKCIPKTCQSASQEIKTHEDCNAYLSSCTLSKTGKGCMSLPLKCEMIELEEGCRLRQSIGLNSTGKNTKECAWKNNKCQDKSCYTAPITRDSNIACQDYMKGCYVNNEKRGCWVLPECSQRALQETCEIQNSFDCVWDEGNSKCLVRNCVSTLFSIDRANYKTAQSCNQYRLNSSNCPKPDGIGCCTLNDLGLGCMKKPDTCSQLKTKDNCREKSLYSDGDCLWTGDACVLKSCSALNLKIYSLNYNHQNCYQTSYNSCTVNEDGTACISFKSSCSQYVPAEQCNIDSNGNECVIRQNQTTGIYSCDLKKCGDVASIQYNSFAACQEYSETCTVIARVSGKGCIDKQQNCYNYLFPEQCFKNLDGSMCVWNGKRCWDQDKVDCSRIVLINYSTQTCEDVAFYCKANDGKTGCILKTCYDYITQTGKTGGPPISSLTHCQKLKANKLSCSVNNALTGCVPEKDRCPQYSVQDCYNASTDRSCATNGLSCYKQFTPCSNWSNENDADCKKNREFCKYPLGGVGKVPCVNKSCDEKTGVNLTEQICHQFDETCTVSKDKTKCILIQTSCGTYKEENLCVKSEQSNCIWQVGTTSECVGITTLIEADKNCSYKKGTGLTYEDCQGFSTFCSVNRAGTECVARKQCGGYETRVSDCYRSENELCIQSAQNDADAKCQSSKGVTCEQIFLGKDTVYTFDKCSKINEACTNQGTSGCTLKTCQNAVGPFTHETCVKWKNACTVNASNNGCVEMKSNCLNYPSNQCLRSLIEGPCMLDVKQNICIKKTCYSSDDTLTSDAQCESYMSTCTVAQAGGCISRNSCDSYVSELQCVVDNQNRLCFWNPTLKKCALFECKTIEKTEKYDSHDECYELNNIQDPKKQNKFERCTVNFVVDPNDQSISYPSGCMNLQACKDYHHKEQCVIDSSGLYCHWNTDNPENEFCETLSCESADPNKYQTHKACSELPLNKYTQVQDKCTVGVTEIAPGVLSAYGCKNRADCEEYKIEDQCRYSSTGQECKWDSINSACYTRLCSKAPQTFTTHERCSDFAPNCTLSSTLAGCMDLTPKCEDYQVKSQCTKSVYGNVCYWNGAQCVTRECSNTPEDLDGECSKYLDTCENSGNQRCVTIDCEQYSFVTDIACKQAGLGGQCTTDGTRCVLRTTCEDARTQDACRVNNLGQQCVWNPPTATSDAYCEISICELASSTDYVSELQCKSYNSQCTLKKQGGCKQIQDCNSFESETSCTVSKDGKVCVWEKDKGCRSNDCTDLTGTDHFKCKKQNKQCTTSKTGKCVNMAATCAEYLIEGSCVETSDGLPCLWVKALQNVNNTQGQCIQYLKCEDIPLTKDSECKSVLSKCTSNGSSCTPIKKCENLNSTNCNKGSDGQCMLAFKDTTSTTKTCMIFKSCSDAFYKTHSECQGVSSYCTTNGTQCMDVKNTCQEYTDRSSCYITTATNSSTTTNICVWDGSCRNQACSDISGSNHQYCNSKMSSCTSDGTKCMTIQTCESYNTSPQCNNGYAKIQGINNPCYWTDVTKTSGSYCRVKSCIDILPASTFFCATISTCVYDATKQSCITKQNSCSSYQDQTACNSGTLSSKTCYWANNQCSDVTGCQVITEQAKCLSLRGCSYITQNGTSKCVPQDCQSVYQQTNSCKFIQIFNSEATKTCMIQNGLCTSVDPSILMQDTCLINSNYAYTWDTAKARCVSCYEKPAPPNDTDNDTNNTDVSAQKISIVLMFMAMVVG
ncbi:unnamed protein product (macronuclear) [Paramecium tetraurelia]|uniref:Uncharacterized protein n=1 Tax=Paramecium tetraurelia TaxID=5888 RepID=A0BL52_PARTE|nr:uncharacterized protein GSPATT00029900001 [Paramecium tetraurelia]CAK59269.1 unnamed protein product [Paramecium tetraurelia]|eukprot:XP_001426667.1 hypothetical protein (macronuclear) [Paramecium tetraurelia strain d4-2]